MRDPVDGIAFSSSVIARAHHLGEQAELGVEKSVEVGAGTASKPCGKAGLKADDLILEVVGKKPTDAESLRRLSRDALALGDASLKLKRGDKSGSENHVRLRNE